LLPEGRQGRGQPGYLPRRVRKLRPRPGSPADLPFLSVGVVAKSRTPCPAFSFPLAGCNAFAAGRVQPAGLGHDEPRTRRVSPALRPVSLRESVRAERQAVIPAFLGTVCRAGATRRTGPRRTPNPAGCTRPTPGPSFRPPCARIPRRRRHRPARTPGNV